MPELPEVETVRRELEPILINQKILSASLVDAVPHKKYQNLELCVNQTIKSVNRRGKFLILALSNNLELIIHLGMTGVIAFEPFEKHLRVKLELKDNTLYFQDVRRFGRFLVVNAQDYKSMPTLHTMGPEPFSKEFSNKHFFAALQKSNTAIKNYLLSQKPVAGLGNIYVDEALWQVKINPQSKAKNISKAKVNKLRQAIIEILAASIKAQGTTLNDYRTVSGEVGEYAQQLNVYSHTGKPCPRCKTSIERIVLAGRSTHFCPKCQATN